MGALIGDLLPLAAGIALSPVPVIATVLVLLAPGTGPTSAAYALGWVAGIVAVTVPAALLVGAVDADADEGASDLGGWIRIALGLLLLVAARRQSSGRPRGDAVAEPPSWMAAVATTTPWRALGLGAALAALNPKNLLLGLAAGSAIGQAEAAGTGAVVPVVVFVLLASATVLGPVLAHAVARERVRAPLASLQNWLQANSTALMTVLLLVLGVTVLGQGLSSVTAA